MTNMLIYGQSGMGKTMLAATCESPLLIDIEAGTMSLSQANIQRIFGDRAYNYEIPSIPCKTFGELTDAISYIEKHAGEYRTIIVDSLTEVAEVTLLHLKKANKDARQAYMQLSDDLTTFIRRIRDLPLDVVMIASEEAANENDITVYRPAVPGSKFSQKLPYFFDIVARMTVNKTSKTRELITEPSLRWIAKDRTGMLPSPARAHIGELLEFLVETV